MVQDMKHNKRGYGRHMSIDYDKIRQFINLVEKNQLSEMTIIEGDLSVTIKAKSTVEVSVRPKKTRDRAVIVPDYEPTHQETPSAEPVVSMEHVVEIKSPMVGVFYRCPSPDSPPYVEVGDEVEVGQTIGLIEAMKVFSEVLSEVAGRLVSVPVESSKLVQQGEVLAEVDTSFVSGEYGNSDG